MKTLNSKQVRETAAGKSISAWIILKDGKYIATVQAHFGNSLVLVDVWTNEGRTHAGRAGGYGYDKFTAALSGAIINGNMLFNHAVPHPDSEELLEEINKATPDFQRQIEKEYGVRPANYRDGKYASVYYESGLHRLSLLGYTVIKAI